MATDKPSKLLRSARRQIHLNENLRAKLKTRERWLRTELAEVRKHLKKPDIDDDEGSIGEDDRSDEEKHYPKPEMRKAKRKRNIGRG